MLNKFDTKNVEDLPEKIRSKLKKPVMLENTKKLYDLFNEKNILTIDEIIASLYRDHSLDVERQWVSATLYNLSRRNRIINAGKRGVYQKVVGGEV